MHLKAFGTKKQRELLKPEPPNGQGFLRRSRPSRHADFCLSTSAFGVRTTFRASATNFS